MAGIVGEVAFHGDQADLSTVCRMSEAMTHTPYGFGTCSWGWVVLGHRRHCAAPAPHAATQPLVDDRLGLGVALTGDLSNRESLREELDGEFPFRNSESPEVALAAYHRWGERFVERLEGSFALAVVDAFREKVLLARDAEGAKPLYLARGPGLVRFASTAESLHAVGGPYPSNGVNPVPPAAVLVFEPSGRSIERTPGNLDGDARLTDCPGR
jgi:asparagine synthetase B (glutamine-hydrolysing)